MKVIIPVAGAGTRLRPHTYTQPKPLILVAGKPIIAFIIEDLQRVGIQEFVFVIGYLGEKIKDYIQANHSDIQATFVYQEDRKGLGHAIWTAKNEVENELELLIVLGDIIFETDLKKIIDSPQSCLGVRKVSVPREFGIVELLEDHEHVKKMVEKPTIPKSDVAIVGIYKIKEVAHLMACLEENITQNVRSLGEIQLTDALQKMVEQGVSFHTHFVDTWFDCGKKDVLLETNAILLDKNCYDTENIATFENTIVIHPVSIGKNCTIQNSIIGPHVTIGNNASIESSILKNSIIGNFTALDQVVLHDSIIGSDTAIKGIRQSLNIGDNTEIDFS